MRFALDVVFRATVAAAPPVVGQTRSDIAPGAAELDPAPRITASLLPSRENDACRTFASRSPRGSIRWPVSTFDDDEPHRRRREERRVAVAVVVGFRVVGRAPLGEDDESAVLGEVHHRGGHAPSACPQR